MKINTLGLMTMMKKEYLRIKDIWKQSILAPVISNLLFFVVFGVALADRIATFEGFSYLTVLVPGLVAMGLMMNALQNPIFSLVIAKYSGNISDLLMLPLTGMELAFGYLFGGMVRGLAVAIVTLIVGMIFTPVPFTSPLLILLFLFLIGGTFTSLGCIIGVLSKDFDQGNFIPTFVINPLIYLGGVFYSIDQLPNFLQIVSKFNPLLYMIDGLRYSFLGVGDISIGVSVAVTSLMFVVTFSIASRIFQTGYKLKT
jgi:ABC-2 type transport system permease protein